MSAVCGVLDAMAVHAECVSEDANADECNAGRVVSCVGTHLVVVEKIVKVAKWEMYRKVISKYYCCPVR